MPHLVGIRDLETTTARALIDAARAMRKASADGSVLASLRGKTIGLLFIEASTRTRTSFERAARNLGADVLILTPDSASTTKGESLLDTARTLRAVGVDAFVLRHRYGGASHFLAARLDRPVLNAGDGVNEHPTQALLDALTMEDRLGDLRGRTIVIVGDVRHSRVARSNAFLLPRLGAHVLFTGPRPLLPRFAPPGVELVPRFEDALARADAVMMLRVQRERLGRTAVASMGEIAREWGLDADRLASLGRQILVLHPAPMNRGDEIDDRVAYGASAAIFEQMRNGVFVRMAALDYALQGSA